MSMKLDAYQLFTRSTAIYPKDKADFYLALGLASEAGEVAGIFKRLLRGDYEVPEAMARLHKELGDVLWYISQVTIC